MLRLCHVKSVVFKNEVSISETRSICCWQIVLACWQIAGQSTAKDEEQSVAALLLGRAEGRRSCVRPSAARFL